MKREVLITNILSEPGKAISQAFRKEGFYVYGTDVEEDFDNSCDRFLRFDINEFVVDADYRIKFSQIFEELIPRLSSLINLGKVPESDYIDDISLGDWTKLLNENITGAMLLTKLFKEKLVKNIGSIVNIILQNEERLKLSPVEEFCLMSMIAFTKALAIELEGQVRVNSIAGFSALKNSNEKSHISIPMDLTNANGKVGKSMLVANLSIYLSSADSAFIHGAVFHV